MPGEECPRREPERDDVSKGAYVEQCPTAYPVDEPQAYKSEDKVRDSDSHRLEQRGLNRALAGQRISKQLPLARKIELADFVLWNSGSAEFLEAQVNRLVSVLAPTTAPAPGAELSPRNQT